jgi:hypothetical protein
LPCEFLLTLETPVEIETLLPLPACGRAIAYG